MTDIVELTRDEGIHVHVVAHSRKPEQGVRRMQKVDIRGASEQADLVDNVILITRNEEKAEKLLGLEYGSDDYNMVKNLPDTRFDVAKQRHGDGWTGTISLSYWPAQMRWTEDRKITPTPFEF